MFLPVTLQLLSGFWESMKVFLLTLLFALPLGLVISFGSMSRFRPLRTLTRGFVWIIRGTPLMLQLIIIFYGNKSQQYRQVGNAVPPMLGQVVAEKLKEYLKG